MRKITFYSSIEPDIERLKSSLKAQNLSGKFHLEKYYNPLRTEKDVFDFVKKFFESDIFVVGDYGDFYSRVSVGRGMATYLGVINHTIQVNTSENYPVFF